MNDTDSENALLWKCAAIALGLLVLWCALENYGWFPAGGGWNG